TTLVKDFNISMGYPLQRSSLFTLFELIFKAQLSKKGHRYYTKDYLKVIRHPFIKNLKLLEDETVTRVIVHKIEEILTGKEKANITGSLFIELHDIEKCDELYSLLLDIFTPMNIQIAKPELISMVQAMHTLVFTSWEEICNFKKLAEVLDTFVNVLIEKSFMERFPLNLNIAMKILTIKDAFATLSFNEEEFSTEELFKIFEGEISREIVAFIGSPLKGLQILGLFETRSLNFENVIVLDVNEGALPRLNIYEPLIPREVMISLNLDRLELEEEIQRYQFMRLISSADQVHLVYQESKDKEKSRFVEELVWEKQKQLKKMDAVTVTRPRFEVQIQSQNLEIKKTPEMIQALKKHKYSASSINTYLRDPIEFYYSYVLGLREQEDFLDEPESKHIGTFIHEILQHSFLPFLNKTVEINAKFRKNFFEMFDLRFAQTFGQSLHSDAFLLKSVLTERLSRFLDNEENNLQRRVRQILYLENRFEETIALSCGNIRFGYIVDRVDEMADGTIMIIDYKSGSSDLMPKAIASIESMELSRSSILENIKSFQIPLYFHYLNQRFKDQPINAALYNLRTLEVRQFIDAKRQSQREEINNVFLRVLDHVMNEILNPEIPFTLTEQKVLV
ncbi:MAG: PD-(D/E)XK nuclease family protein, partial [Candidatus Omnitrophica bacterium]|nr:PD-(D/E)XK nuclease family protein [Candidatus Omnitrophota bacterium]